ncbi:hypothetical protein HD806DRAFT_497145 [Xylariaceae sp. AK1471]|nr:hypothetical protein HD806DRAFT_497145 [Xylariaceae sp. AK1471]
MSRQIAVSSISYLRQTSRVSCPVYGCGGAFPGIEHRFRRHLHFRHTNIIEGRAINGIVKRIKKGLRPYSLPLHLTKKRYERSGEWLTNSAEYDEWGSMNIDLYRRSSRKTARASSVQISISNMQIPRLSLSRGLDQGSQAGKWYIEGTVNGSTIDALADTGANINAISRDEAGKIGLVPEPDSAGKAIRLPSGKTCLSLGTVVFNFSFAGDKAVHTLHCSIVEELEHSMILCYDFLRKTETLTRFFKERIKEVVRSGIRQFSLCLLNDYSASDEATARMNGFINGAPARVVPDTGSGIMAISASYARRLGLEVDSARKTQVAFADGSIATTSGIVKAAWNFLPPDPQSELHTCIDDRGQAASADGGKRLMSFDTEKGDDAQDDNTWDYDWEYEWHVIENLPVDAILSLDFIKAHNVFRKHEHAFVDTTPRSKLADLFGICELPDGNEGLSSLAEEFLSDLNSSEPFTYNMVVRETARRSEIQRRIRELPLDSQSAQRILEQERVNAWDRIHDSKRSHGDWSRLRDEYVSSLRLQPAQLSWPQHATAPTETVPNRLKSKWRKFRHRRSRNVQEPEP